ncbi:MAG: AMP-binding protein [Pseudomonadota bacterium]
MSSNANLFHQFFSPWESDSSRPLLTTLDGHVLSYGDLMEQSGRIANGMRSLGLKSGDVVSVQVEKSPQSLALYLACLRGGFVYHPLNPAYKLKELLYFLESAEPRLTVCTDNTPLAELVSGMDVHCWTLDGVGQGSMIDDSESQSEIFSTVASDANDIAALLYSSGTTGRPKGIPLTHGNLLANAKTLTELWGFKESDCLLHVLPIFHVHGLFVALGCVFLSGARMVWLPRFDAAEVSKAFSQCNVMMGVPTYYSRLLAEEELDYLQCEKMRLFISGSAPLSHDTFNEFSNRTGHRILERYGMTETGMNTSNPLIGQRKPGTVGRPLPGVDVRVVASNGQLASASKVGEIQVRGDNVFSGYWKTEDGRTDFTEDGFFKTGDLGTVDESGYFSIVGRSKDLIISGGLNIYPKEVEVVLEAHEQVEESAVVGVPDKDFGERVIAVVVPKGDTEGLETKLKSVCKQELANFKVPKRFVFVDELPRNAMGKVQKNILRDRLHQAS